MAAKQGGAVAHANKRMAQADAEKLKRKSTAILDYNLKSQVSRASEAISATAPEVNLKEMFENQQTVKNNFNQWVMQHVKKKNPSTAYKINGKKNSDFYNANSKKDASK